jgi:hypothetical protein
MVRKLAFLVAFVGAIALTLQAADARTRKPVDRRLDAIGTAAGAPFTALWFWNHAPDGAAATIGTIGCAAASPIVATAVLKRPLTYREAHILVGSCVIPIIGGWLVNEAYNKGWLWAPDEKPARRVHDRHRGRHHRR